MIYKFTCRATGDVIMLGPHGDHLLSLLGREPAAKGIIEVAHMADAMARIEAAVAADEAAHAEAQRAGEPAPADAVALRQRMWPMLEMLRAAQAADVPVVWGV
jgi:Domain of unknown function (DUF1840)